MRRETCRLAINAISTSADRVVTPTGRWQDGRRRSVRRLNPPLWVLPRVLMGLEAKLPIIDGPRCSFFGWFFRLWATCIFFLSFFHSCFIVVVVLLLCFRFCCCYCSFLFCCCSLFNVYVRWRRSRVRVQRQIKNVLIVSVIAASRSYINAGI